MVLIKIYNIAPRKALPGFIEPIFINTIQAIKNLKTLITTLGMGKRNTNEIYLGISVKKAPKMKYLK